MHITILEARETVSVLVFATLAGGGLLGVTLLVLGKGTRLVAELQHQLLGLALLALPLFALLTPAALLHEASMSSSWFPSSPLGKFADGPPALELPAPAWGLVVSLWALGVAVLSLRFAWRVLGAIRLRRTARPIESGAWYRELQRVRAEAGLRRQISLFSHPEVASPMVWSLPFPFLVIPEPMAKQTPDPAHARLTFLHELAHVQRNDSAWALMSELICALFWFHPLAWIARARLTLTREMAADSRVLMTGVLPSSYSSHLLELFREGTRGRASLAGGHSVTGDGPLSKRLLSILREDHNHAAPPRRTSRLIGLGFALAFGSCCLAQQVQEAAAPTAASLAARLEPAIQEAMELAHVPGATVSVVKNGELLYAKGFGRPYFGTTDEIEPREVDAKKTIFRIGSVSKVVTAVAVLQCVDRGLLDLDADVNDYLEAFQVGDEFPEPVRVRHLLTHTAGFDQFGYGRHEMRREDKCSLGEFLKDDLVRIRPPGELICYDTYAITLAGHLVELVSGLEYEEYLVRNIFEPLSMTRSNVEVPEEYAEDTARGHLFQQDLVEQRWEYMNTDPASTVNSTAVDMAKLATMFLQGGVFANERILSTASVNAMMSRQFSNDPALPGHGLSFFEDFEHGVAAFMHSGSMTGFGCVFFLIPEQELGIFVAYNQEGGRVGGAAISAVMREFVGAPPARTLLPKADDVDVTPYAGRYAYNCYNHSRPERGGWRAYPLDITKTDDGALLYRDDEYFAVGDHTFQRADGKLMKFVIDPAGAVSHMLVQQSVFERF